MKKNVVLLPVALLLMNTAFAGGIITNSNQSAQFARILSRNASTDLDAVYFNPAGLTQMENGFYFALDNQSIFQNRSINSEFPTLNTHDYSGTVSAPLFPTAFAVYKKDKWAFSLGFGPNGGGGTAKYDTGLPSFEKQISTIPASLTASHMPTSGYSVNMKFEASSVFYGTQFNASYSINKIITVSLGARMINAVNTYTGYIKDIQVNPTNPPSGNIGFDGTMRSASSVFTTLSAVSTGTANALAPYVPTAGGYTLPQLLAAEAITPTQAAMLAGGLSGYNSSMTVSQIYDGYNQQAAVLAATSANTEDKNVDTKQTGTGFTPIIGVNLHFEKLNIGLRYEHQTTLILTNSPSADDNYSDQLFPEKFGNDIPGIISGGADYKITKALKISGSFTSYLDKGVGWGDNIYGQHKSIDKNYLELALGLEYKLTDKFAVSAGYLNSNMGVSQKWQSDFTYENDSHTEGIGFQWNISSKLVLDAGMMLTTYKDATKTFDSTGGFDEANTALISNFGPYNETYGKDTFTFAFGIGYKIF